MSYSDLFCPSSVRAFKFSNDFSSKASIAQISYEASLGWWNERLLKLFRSVDQDGHRAHIKILLKSSPLESRMPGAEAFHKSSGTGGLPKLLK